METGWQVTCDRIVCLLPWDYLSVVRHLFRHTCPGTMPAAAVSGWDRSPAFCPLRNVYPGMPRRSIQRRTRQHDPGGQGLPITLRQSSRALAICDHLKVSHPQRRIPDLREVSGSLVIAASLVRGRENACCFDWER